MIMEAGKSKICRLGRQAGAPGAEVTVDSCSGRAPLCGIGWMKLPHAERTICSTTDFSVNHLTQKHLHRNILSSV